MSPSEMLFSRFFALALSYICGPQPFTPDPRNLEDSGDLKSVRNTMKLPLVKPDAGDARDRLAILGLLSLVAIVYFPAISFDFVNWDDSWYVTNNPTVQRWSFENLISIATKPAVKNYAPITMFSFLLDYTFWKHNVGGYHFTNILLHALNGVLVYALLFQLSGSRRVGWLTAALFLVHPVQLESVAWISSRKGLLAATFLLAGSIFWFRKNRELRHEGYAIALLFLALLSKAIAVVVPPIWLLYDLKIRKDRPAQSVVRQFVPVFLCVCLIFITLHAQSSVYGGIRKHMELGKLHLLGIDAIILWRYIGMLVFPSHLSVLYDPPLTGIMATIVMAVCGWLIVGGAIWKLRDRYPWLFLIAASFLLFLLPVLNLLPISTLMNDRYLYMPSIPFFAMLVLGWDRLFEFVRARTDRSTKMISEHGLRFCAQILAPLLAIAILVSMAKSHLPVWKNSLALWQDASSKQPQLAVVQYQLADALVETGDRQAAIGVLDWAMKNCHPDAADRTRMSEMRENLLRQLSSNE